MDGETEILALIGKIVAQWNYAEHCSRQIIRKRLATGHIDDYDNIKLSKKTPRWMEDELRDEVLPRWNGTQGEMYLQSLIAAFSAARDYRNDYVHGLLTTCPATPDGPARAVILPSKPHKDKMQAPRFVTAADIHPVATHMETLGAFACEVGNAFDASGQRATNKDGSVVVTALPTPITPLQTLQHLPLVT